MSRTSCYTDLVPLRNLTITVEEDVARWARLWAARHASSVSRLVGEMLRERMREDEGYDAALRQFLAEKPHRFEGSAPYPTRDELHERDRLR